MTVKWIVSTSEAYWKENEIILADTLNENLLIFNKTEQEVEGFGGCFNELGWSALSHLDEDIKSKVLDELFDPVKGCRFNLCRLPIGASDYAEDWYSCSEIDDDYMMDHFSIERDKKHLIPYIRSALSRRPDMTLFASPWSPPIWMKRPRAYNYGKIRWEKRVLEAYALYFLKFVQEYGKENIQIAQVHPQNEPVADQKFPSCVWTGEELRDFIRDYLGPIFENQGMDTQIWLGTVNAPNDSDFIHTDYDYYVNTILGDEEAQKYISGIGYQWGGKHAIQRTHEAWPDMRLLQTENECGNGKNDWDYAKYIFTLMKHYFINGANGYIYWNMVLSQGGESTWGWRQNSMITINMDSGTVIYNPEFYLMKHFSHFVEKGAVRLVTAGQWSGNTLAFRNPDGKTVIVICNPFKTTKRATFTVYGKALSIEMPPDSFNTVVIMQE